MTRRNPCQEPRWSQPSRWKQAAVFTVIVLIAVAAYAIQTNVLELGFNSTYDGTVKIVRDVAGKMTFVDNEVTTPVTLAELNQGKDTHADLLGLAADDHTQYLDATRHTSTHDATYNGALATDADVNANTTLGGHLGDAQIHIKRNTAETISGNWIFSGVPEYQSDLLLSAGGGVGDQKIRFEDGAQDAEVAWSDTSNRFELNRDLYVEDNAQIDGSLGIGTPPSAALHVSGTELRLAHTSATGDPFISMYQAATRRSYLQHIDIGNELRIASEFGEVSLWTGPSGVESRRVTVTGTGDVGIGEASPAELLHVNGNARVDAILLFEEIGSSPGGTAGFLKMYAKESQGTTELFVRDGAGSESQLSSHNFEGFDPDPADPLPFSFHASNEFVGKAMWADVSGALRELESLTGKTFLYYQDLPTTSVLEVVQWQSSERARRVELKKEEILRREPEAEIAIADAWELRPATEEMRVMRPVTRYEFDLDRGVVVPLEGEEETIEQVPTGEIERRLKPGVRFDPRSGKFYRKRTLEEVDAGPVSAPTLPKWVLDRVPR